MPAPLPQTGVDAFMNTICAHPYDDTPRLIFADWLEERDHAEVARFIRVQIEEANLPPFDWRRVALIHEADQLLPAVQKFQPRKLPKWTAKCQSVYHRGFPSAWAIGPSHLESLSSLRKYLPVTSVLAGENRLKCFDHAKRFDGLRDVGFGFNQSNLESIPSLAPALRTGHFQHLRRISANVSTRVCCGSVAESAKYGPIEAGEFIVGASNLEYFLKTLADGPHRDSLHYLAIRCFDGELNRACIKTLLSFPNLSTLICDLMNVLQSKSPSKRIVDQEWPWRHLVFIDCNINEKIFSGLEAPNLESLIFWGNTNSDSIFDSMIQRPWFSQLRCFSIQPSRSVTNLEVISRIDSDLSLEWYHGDDHTPLWNLPSIKTRIPTLSMIVGTNQLPEDSDVYTDASHRAILRNINIHPHCPFIGENYSVNPS